jgi:hypothetical protein
MRTVMPLVVEGERERILGGERPRGLKPVRENLPIAE